MSRSQGTGEWVLTQMELNFWGWRELFRGGGGEIEVKMEGK
jgi:hypothetical protein